MTNDSYVSDKTLIEAVARMRGTADHLLKIWFVLKHMGFHNGSPIEIDTGNSTGSLKRLFSFGDAEGRFFIPFAHTARFMTMKEDASRSIIQTTIQRWYSSDSVVTCNPTAFIDIKKGVDDKLIVNAAREYPRGLGINKDGFAPDEDTRVSIPLNSFAVWYGRQTPIPKDQEPISFLIEKLRDELHLSEAEMSVIFVSDSLPVTLSETKLTDRDVNSICADLIKEDARPVTTVLPEDARRYEMKVRSMMTINDKPGWLRQDPEVLLKTALSSGARAILLYGPPRTGKTRAIDALFPRTSSDQLTIQIHDAWGYEDLVLGLQPVKDAERFEWKYGVLGDAIRQKKKIIVMEEINRTQLSRSLGEIFSLIEGTYRGEKNAITLKNGDKFFVPTETVFLMTMNNLDRSTEDIDDALLGRFHCIEFAPRVESLNAILRSSALDETKAQKIRELFITIQSVYPLGHGYFSDLNNGSDPIAFYMSRIRPVLVNYLQGVKPQELDQIDNFADSLFARA